MSTTGGFDEEHLPDEPSSDIASSKNKDKSNDSDNSSKSNELDSAYEYLKGYALADYKRIFCTATQQVNVTNKLWPTIETQLIRLFHDTFRSQAMPFLSYVFGFTFSEDDVFIDELRAICDDKFVDVLLDHGVHSLNNSQIDTLQQTLDCNDSLLRAMIQYCFDGYVVSENLFRGAFKLGRRCMTELQPMRNCGAMLREIKRIRKNRISRRLDDELEKAAEIGRSYSSSIVSDMCFNSDDVGPVKGHHTFLTDIALYLELDAAVYEQCFDSSPAEFVDSTISNITILVGNMYLNKIESILDLTISDQLKIEVDTNDKTVSIAIDLTAMIPQWPMLHCPYSPIKVFVQVAAELSAPEGDPDWPFAIEPMILCRSCFLRHDAQTVLNIANVWNVNQLVYNCYIPKNEDELTFSGLS